MDATIVPFVPLLTGQPPTAPEPEATETFWLPLARVRSGELDGRFPHVNADGDTVQLPCGDFEGRRIWGLTSRIVTGLVFQDDEEVALETEPERKEACGRAWHRPQPRVRLGPVTRIIRPMRCPVASLLQHQQTPGPIRGWTRV